MISPTGKKTVSKSVSTARGENVTIVKCILPVRFPALFYKGAPPGTLQLNNSSGYMTTDLFVV